MENSARRSFRMLTINTGSSSVKFAVFDTSANTQLFKSALERVASLEDAVRSIPALLKAQGIAALNAVGHHVAHGGARFRDACAIDAGMAEAIEACVPQVAVFDTAFHQTIPARAATYGVPQRWRDAGVRRFGFHGTSYKYVSRRWRGQPDAPDPILHPPPEIIMKRTTSFGTPGTENRSGKWRDIGPIDPVKQFLISNE